MPRPMEQERPATPKEHCAWLGPNGIPIQFNLILIYFLRNWESRTNNMERCQRSGNSQDWSTMLSHCLFLWLGLDILIAAAMEFSLHYFY